MAKGKHKQGESKSESTTVEPTVTAPAVELAPATEQGESKSESTTVEPTVTAEELQEESHGGDQPQGEVATVDDINAPTVEALPISCDECGKEFLAEGPSGTPSNGSGLFCSEECLALNARDDADDLDAAAKAGAAVSQALEAGALEDALAAGHAAADAGADVRAAVAGVLGVVVDVVVEQVEDSDTPAEPRPSYEQLKMLAKYRSEALVEVRMRRGHHAPQLVAGLVCQADWRAYPLLQVADFGDLCYLRALAEDQSIHVRLVE